MVKIISGPPQAPVSLTVIVDVIAVPVRLAEAVKSIIFPVPLKARPIDALLFVQLNVEPVFTTKAPTLMVAPGQTLMLLFCVMILSGLMVITNVSAAEEQPSLLAITLSVPVIAVPVLLAGAVKIMSPLPLADIPIAGLLLVHARVEPDTLLFNGMLTLVPGQKP